MMPVALTTILGRAAVPTSILSVLLYVCGFLAFSSAVCYLHPRLRRPERRAVRQAITSWWPSVIVCGLAACGGLPAAVILFGALSVATLREMLRMLPTADQHPKLVALAYAAVPIHYGALLLGGERLFFGAILLYAFLVLPLLAASLCGPAIVKGAVPRVQLSLMLTVLALSHVVRVFALPTRTPAGGAGLAALLLLCIMLGDAFQYFFGKLLGRNALAPALSPKKTWEGLLGGMLVAAGAAAAAAPALAGLSHVMGAALGAGLCVLGLFGDLLVSALKRSAGVKDTGAVLPGQGGVLDRCDSLLLSAPLYYSFMVQLLS